jgi:macrolide transport system ATP-binding/permease protein
VLSPKGGDVIGNDQDDIVIVPWTTFKFRIANTISPPRRVSTFADQMPKMHVASLGRSTRNEHLHQIYVQAGSPAQVAEAREQIKQVLARRHLVDPDDAYQINDMTEVSKVTHHVVGALSALGLIIGGVSLLVGGVGIMNIMLVSVTERTREIGLRMAVGASGPAILRQFLIEATVLCLLGGLVGIVVGHLGSMAVGAFMGWPTIMSLSAPLVAVGVAATVGILFGYYPARKASRLNPIDALRYE